MITTPDYSAGPHNALVPLHSPRPANARPALDRAARDKLRPPTTRGFTFIPSEENLRDLIERALEAFRNGIFWDRGSILNIVV